MSFFRRPNKKLPCRYLLCTSDLIEQVEIEVTQWDEKCFRTKPFKVNAYVCRAHADLLERAAYAGYELWLTQEGWVYVSMPTSTLDWGNQAWVK